MSTLSVPVAISSSLTRTSFFVASTRYQASLILWTVRERDGLLALPDDERVHFAVVGALLIVREGDEVGAVGRVEAVCPVLVQVDDAPLLTEDVAFEPSAP